MSEKVRSVFVAIPAFVANGTPLDSDIADAMVENLEVEPKDVQVVEAKDGFYVFLKSLPFDFVTANHLIERAAQLCDTHERSVHRLTKLVRRADKFQSDLYALKRENVALRAEKDALKLQLSQAEAERSEKYEACKAIEGRLHNVIGSFATK
jgi:hypothetical protein